MRRDSSRHNHPGQHTTMALLILRLHLLLWPVIGLSSDPVSGGAHLLQIPGLPNPTLSANQGYSSAAVYMQNLYDASQLTIHQEDFVSATLPLECTWNGTALSTVFPVEPDHLLSTKAEIVFKVDMSRKSAKFFLTNHQAEVCSDGRCSKKTGILRRNKESGDTWIIYDITDLVNSHAEEHKNYNTINIPLVVKPDLIPQDENPFDPENKPILVTYEGEVHPDIFKNFGQKTHLPERHKRSAERGSKRDAKNPMAPCHLETWYVNFEKLKWDEWIIQPRGYNANYCIGRCTDPLTDHINVTNHAYVKSVYRSMDERAAPNLPEAQCVPIRLQPLRLLYMNNNSLLLRTMQELSASNCGCM